MKGHLKILLVVALALSGETVMARKSNSATQKNAAAVAENTDGLGNISKRKREELKQKIGEIKSFLEQSGDTNAVRLLRFAAELEREVGEKKYGLVFEEHRERVDAELERNLPVLTENKQRFIDNGGEVNFLIEGDNLAALKLLEKTHRGRIDVIYIDPPYNTGNKDFVYNDSYVDKTDGYRHSKWLSFMKKRLEIARRLMSDKGVIFILIDDNEQAQLKVLCDDIFGENNFLGNITWESTTQPTNAGKARFQLQKKVEYILTYAKNNAKRGLFRLRDTKAQNSYPHMGKFGKCRFEIIEKSDTGRYKRDTMKFKILGKYPRAGKRWQIGEDTARLLEKEGKVEIVGGLVKRAIYPEDENESYYVPFWSHFTSEIGTALSAKKELSEILEIETDFETVKPVDLISELIMHIPSPLVILDFFAGSGTTGHAVMKLNAEDGGHRTFILVTNNENGICENVTYKRLKNVIDKEKYKARLKYCKVDYVTIAEKVYYEYADDLLKHIRELVELENGIDFTHDESVAIALTTKDAENLVADEARLAKCRVFYRGHNVVMPLAVRNALERQGVEIRIIPTYYYPEQED